MSFESKELELKKEHKFKDLMHSVFLKYANQDFNAENLLKFFIDILEVAKKNESIWDHITVTHTDSQPMYFEYLQICEHPIISKKDYNKWQTRIQISYLHENPAYSPPFSELSFPLIADMVIESIKLCLEKEPQVLKDKTLINKSRYFISLNRNGFCLEFKGQLADYLYLFTCFDYPVCIYNLKKDSYFPIELPRRLNPKKRYIWLTFEDLNFSRHSLIFFPDITNPDWAKELTETAEDCLFQDLLVIP